MKSIKEKTLEMNLDAKIYGTIAEIGAGQEVARNFFRAGGASGTVAKAISAYDMIVSDTIYGKEESGRYVVESRIKKMLTREFNQLLDRLSAQRDPETTYFAFADTIATTSFNSDREGHGWLGVRFQHVPGAKASDLTVHVVLKETQVHDQQYAVGVLGVNMVSACFKRREDPADLVSALVEHLDPNKIEIDYMSCTGPAFEKYDDRILSLEVVKNRFTDAAFFAPDGKVFQPAEKLYKKNILVLRGSFRPPTLVSLDMLQCGIKSYCESTKCKPEDVIVLAEITMSNLKTWGDNDDDDFLARVDLLGPLGINVMISNNDRHYRLSTFFRRFTKAPVGMVLGYYNLKEMLDEKHYRDLPGGILESFGVLVNHEDKLLVYPSWDEEKKKFLNSDDLDIKEKYQFLVKHLQESKMIVDLPGANKDILHIYSRKVLDMIKNKESGWEEMVPETVVEQIKSSCLFGHCET